MLFLKISSCTSHCLSVQSTIVLWAVPPCNLQCSPVAVFSQEPSLVSGQAQHPCGVDGHLDGPRSQHCCPGLSFPTLGSYSSWDTPLRALWLFF